MLPPADNSVGDQRPKSASGPSGHLRRAGSRGAIRQLKAAPVDSAGREPVLPASMEERRSIGNRLLFLALALVVAQLTSCWIR